MVHKANSIASFFAAYSREEGVAGVANHIELYWEPRMRRQLLAFVQETGGRGLDSLVIEATKRLKPLPAPR